jgi:hypothetical protein
MSRTGGETMDPAAVLLERPRRTGDASGLLQLVEQAGRLGLRHVEYVSNERGIDHRVRGH